MMRIFSDHFPIRFLAIALLLLGNYLAIAQKKQVCFTIDDLPTVTYGITDTVYQEKLTRDLISKLNAAQIPATGFVNEIKLHPAGTLSRFQVRILKLWIDNGLELGNHSYSHFDYNNTSFNRFTADIIKGEKITSELMKKKNLNLRYFRHPFLHAGNTKARADSLQSFLTDHGYIIAPVTLDNDEYLFALAYHRAKAKKDEELALRIGNDYITYMEQKLLYFERTSKGLFGRDIKHVLLIHANALNAAYMDKLAIMFVKNGYEFINLDQALTDPAYQHEISRFGNWGISWIDRWALSEGKKSDFFQNEPSTPEYIVKLTSN
jgi:peptidoglycan/xylan/chitin deacetylase (PgdA/CDA1 family)